ncbi:hypothetical protein CEXT_626021 [Caerostris extrusa]|uniref:Uncharacterized protein n=1 Tax=Caerostris extrusa TaxID=172846 RepID=A0AAV4XYU1_CAEEX|nr:hypothetical protein CEXT_626021 [Caerostris extrusa]
MFTELSEDKMIMDKESFPALLDKMPPLMIPPHGGIITPPLKDILKLTEEIFKSVSMKFSDLLPIDTNIAEIEDSLHQMNTSAKVVQLKNRSKEPIPQRQIVLSANDTNAIIFEIKKMLYLSVRWRSLISGLRPPNVPMFPFLFRTPSILERFIKFPKTPKLLSRQQNSKHLLLKDSSSATLVHSSISWPSSPKASTPQGQVRPALQLVNTENTDFISKTHLSLEGICHNFQLSEIIQPTTTM